MRADTALVAGAVRRLTHDGSNYSAEEKMAIKMSPKSSTYIDIRQLNMSSSSARKASDYLSR